MQAPSSGSRLLRAVAGRVRGRLVLLAAALALRALTGLAVPALLAAAVDAALRHAATGRLAAELGAVLVAGGAGEVAAGLLAASSAARGGAWLRMRLTERVLALGTRSRTPHGETVIRLTQAAVQAAELPTAMAQWGVSVIGSTAAFVLLWVIDWRVGLAFAVGVPVAVVLARRFIGGAAEAQGRYLAAQARIATLLMGALGGARTIRACGTLDTETERVLRPLADVSAAGHRLWRLQRGMVWRFGLLLPAMEVLVLGVAGAGVASHRLAPGQLLAVAGYLAIASQAVEHIDTLFMLAQARAGAARLAATLDEEPPAFGTAAAPGGPGAVSLRGVTVRHEGGTVLDGLDLDLPAGRSTALVGRSGSGKTVLAGLIGRLDDPDEGTVLIDGTPVRELPAPCLRRLVAYAFERPVLLGATVHDAITYGEGGGSGNVDGAGDGSVRREGDGRDLPGGGQYALGRAGAADADPAPHGGLPRPEVVEAARTACADDFIRRLPAGYGTALEQAPMSGGERQRVGLARTLLRRARVFVLDDATSGLDTVTDAQVTRSITQALAGRTRLVVAHRPGTAARCDAVAWLDGGRIRAVGSHEELWQDPEYRAVFTNAPAEAGRRQDPVAPGTTGGAADRARPTRPQPAPGRDHEPGPAGGSAPGSCAAPDVPGRAPGAADAAAAAPRGPAATAEAGRARVPAKEETWPARS